MTTFRVHEVIDGATPKYVIVCEHNEIKFVFRYAYPTFAAAEFVRVNLRAQFDQEVRASRDLETNYLPWSAKWFIGDKPNDNGNFHVHRDFGHAV